MAYKVYVASSFTSGGGAGIDVHVPIFDTGTNLVYDDAVITVVAGTDFAAYTVPSIQAAIQAKILAYSVIQGYGIVSTDIVWPETAGNAVPKVFSVASRSLNSAFQVSATRDCVASYSVDIAATISLVTGQVGTVSLQYADNSGMSTNLVTVNSATNGNTGSLTIGLNLTQTGTVTLSGIIPAGKYVRLLTANTTGTPTFTYRSGQEVLL